MEGLKDLATGKPLPADAIQRVLYVCKPVHVYAIPPLMSMKGYSAADWTVPDPRNNGKTMEIFTARLRVFETAVPPPVNAPASASQEQVKVDILLEDPSNGNLFAAAPYTDAGVVEHAIDSSRFFALRVVGDGRKAVLGIGFEDRSEAFDFGVALQEARKVLGFSAGGNDNGASPNLVAPKRASTAPVGRGPVVRPGLRQTPSNPMVVRSRPVVAGTPPRQQTPEPPAPSKPKDYSLKPGETITVNLGSRKRPEGASQTSGDSAATDAATESQALFSIPPPPKPASSLDETSNAIPFLPPPPGAKGPSNADRRRRPVSQILMDEKKDEKKENTSTFDNAFDDDAEFGDFQ